VLVLAQTHAHVGLGPLSRHGKDILVVWDPLDETTDAYLQASILLALALTSRAHRPADEGNIAALSDIEHRIQSELSRLARMRELASKIEKHAHELQEEVRKGEGKLDVLLKNTKLTLKALNVEPEAAEAEAAVAVGLPPRSLGAGRAALQPDSPIEPLAEAG
jgi:hypothetical protein